MRRAMALLLLTSTFGLRTESIVGEVRDADVHHETTAEAWVHSHDPHGAHAHDATAVGADPSDQSDERGSDHEHGSGSDHCTHAHGAALPCNVSFSLFLNESSVELIAVPVLSDVASAGLSPPPKL